MEMAQAKTSATATDHQIPSKPSRAGRASTQMIWKTKERKKEMAAEMAPLLRAVKKLDTKMLKPASKKDPEKTIKACWVIWESSWS